MSRIKIAPPPPVIDKPFNADHWHETNGQVETAWPSPISAPTTDANSAKQSLHFR